MKLQTICHLGSEVAPVGRARRCQDNVLNVVKFSEVLVNIVRTVMIVYLTMLRYLI